MTDNNRDNDIDMTVDSETTKSSADSEAAKSSTNSGGQIFSNASNFDVTNSQFNDIAGDSTTNTCEWLNCTTTSNYTYPLVALYTDNNNGGGNQVVNQNDAGLHFGNTNVGHGQQNGGGQYSFGGMLRSIVEARFPMFVVDDGRAGSIPHHEGSGSVQYGNRNTGNRQRNQGGVYNFGSTSIGSFRVCRTITDGIRLASK